MYCYVFSSKLCFGKKNYLRRNRQDHTISVLFTGCLESSLTYSIMQQLCNNYRDLVDLVVYIYDENSNEKPV